MSRRVPLTLVLGTVAAAATIAGCGGSTSTAPIPSGAASSVQVTGPTTPTRTSVAATAAPSGPLTHKPEVGKGKGAPPKKLIVRDLIVGKGKAAKAGQTLTVQYVGVLFKNGKQFDASWDNGGKPFTFPLGQGQVIPGWDKGLVGMHVGGRRQLIIPAKLAYGAQGSPPTIPPDSALIFDVDLVDAQ